jgi:release factor glutamine methyltransferase
VELKAVLASAVARLSAEHVPSPRMNAELLLRFTLDCDRAYLYAHPERELTSDEQKRYDAALMERARGVPAQYITGHQEFWGMDLIVSPAVLIPRPETEHVVEAVLRLVAKASGGQECPPHMSIIDVGTGSGCIALALAKELPEAKIYASDISAAALEVARANAARHGVENRIQFHQADLLAEAASGPVSDTTAGGSLAGRSARPTPALPTSARSGQFDIIVSNPPYVGESEADEVQLEVRKFEPRNAVFAGPTGTKVIARLIPQAWEKLRPSGWLVMEISGTIADATEDLLRDWDDVEIVPDLQGIARVIEARKPER